MTTAKKMTPKGTRAKYVPAHIQAIRLLKQLHFQLRAMNESEAHAISWIEPRTLTTKRRIARIAKVITALEEGNTREPG